MKKDFDTVSRTWDHDPGRVKLAGEIAGAIRKTITLTTDMEVLDYGCGTGLITLALRPYVRTITGMDSSRGMLDVLDAKIRKHGLGGISTQQLDMEKGDILEGRFHLVTCSMTLHHVQDPITLLVPFYRCLHPRGHLCLADLDSEAGTFHDTNDGVFHAGFARPVLRRMFIQAGFQDVKDITAATITKDVPQEGPRSFSVFLMTGTK